MQQLLVQAAAAVAWYVALVAITRLAGKRLAGQTATFDLIILISLGVVMQNVLLQEGAAPAFVFVVVVFALHRLVTMACTRSPRLRALIRGRPRPLIRDGVIDKDALRKEDLTIADLKAGLRRVGLDRFEDVEIATLEETGHITGLAKPSPTTEPSSSSSSSATAPSSTSSSAS